MFLNFGHTFNLVFFFVLVIFHLIWVSTINPYLQILENSSRNFSEIFIFWVVTQAVPPENSSRHFSKFHFWGVTQAASPENPSTKNHGHLFSFPQLRGATQAASPENSPIQIMTETLYGGHSDPDIVSKRFLPRKRIIPKHPAGRQTTTISRKCGDKI